MTNIDYKKHRFAVIGLGDTGLSILRFLQYQDANIVKVIDTRKAPPNQDLVTNYKPHYGELSLDLFDDVDIIVISPGVSIFDPILKDAVTRGKKVVGDIELFALAIKDWDSKIIGVTGSNGKTTVTSLTGHLGKAYGLKTLVAGNIGVPVLDSYLEIINTSNLPELIVLELSSFQLESLYSLKLDAATVLNISEDHLDRYRDLLEYAYIKANIFNLAITQILNYDDALVCTMQRPTHQHIWFSKQQDTVFRLLKEDGITYLCAQRYKIINTGELQLLGEHNYLNCLASLALLQAIGVDIYSGQIREGLKTFKGLEHRMQKIVTHNGITFIEDSKGTNVGAVIAGISGLNNPVHLILGGDGKGQDFTPLNEIVVNKCKSVAIYGRDKHKIEEALKNINIPILVCDTLDEAVRFCILNAEINEYVVLSPACASLDMFKNYKERAQAFIDCIYENIK